MINIDTNKNTKTMIRYIFYVNVVTVILIFVNMKFAKIGIFLSLFLSGVQFLMDKMESKVSPLIETHKIASKINNFAGKTHG